MEQKPLPNAVAALVLGILSLITSCMFIGLVLGIIGMVLGGKAKQVYNSAPTEYTGYGMANAGWVMSLIGTILGAIYTIYWLIAVAILGGAGIWAASNMWY